MRREEHEALSEADGERLLLWLADNRMQGLRALHRGGDPRVRLSVHDARLIVDALDAAPDAATLRQLYPRVGGNEALAVGEALGEGPDRPAPGGGHDG